MQKTILIAIIAVVLIAIVLGVYFFMISSPVNTVPGQNNSAKQGESFDIQGMKVEILKAGSGTQAKDGDTVTVNYVGTFPDGKEFDSSIKRNSPFTFLLQEGRVIKGWALGVVGMKVGEKRKLTIPPALAYGPNGFATIPANATLIFEVELLKINPPAQAPSK